jgi:predicted lipid-binding transport protein (Tim44 family)
MKSDLIFVVAGIACLITFSVVRPILKERLKLGPPGLLAALIAALAFLGLCGGGDGLVAALLMPYATLALALLILCLLFWLFRYVPSRFNRGRAQNKADGGDSKRSRSNSRKSAPSSEPSSTRPCRRHPPLGESASSGTGGSQTPANDAATL